VYVPPLFAMGEEAEVMAFCSAHPFALLVTHGRQGLFATHLPVILKREATAGAAFFGHIARANPHWQNTDSGAEALLVFSGPQAYVTPSWYATKKETAKVVPTWNYASVHVRGHVFWPHDGDFLRENLADLTDRHEAGREHPWAMADAPDDFLAMQMRAIVGMRFAVSSFDAKMKMSQNRPAADVDGVIAGLAASEEAGDAAVADLVAARRSDKLR
jgi:transcriptional regulator